MLENFMFSINAILPMFLIMFMGWMLKKKEWIGERFIQEANKILFTIILPTKLFLNVATTNIVDNFNLKFVIFSSLATVIVFVVVWFGSEIFLKEKESIGAFVHSAYRSNYAMIGLALAENILGTKRIAAAPLIIAFVVPMYNILAVILLTVKSPEVKKVSIRKIILSTIKNPLIIGVVLAIPFSCFKITLPFVIYKTLEYLEGMVSPIAFIVIGGSFVFNHIYERRALTLLASIIKTIIIPLVIVIAAWPFQFTSEELMVLFVTFASPTAANSYIMTKNMKGDANLNISVIVVSTLMSVITITAGIYIFKTIGILT